MARGRQLVPRGDAAQTGSRPAANSSYELHAEGDSGSLEVGKLADFIVLDRNIFTIPPREIADVRVLLTVVGGRAVYRDATFAAGD